MKSTQISDMILRMVCIYHVWYRIHVAIHHVVFLKRIRYGRECTVTYCYRSSPSRTFFFMLFSEIFCVFFFLFLWLVFALSSSRVRAICVQYDIIANVHPMCTAVCSCSKQNSPALLSKPPRCKRPLTNTTATCSSSCRKRECYSGTCL